MLVATARVELFVGFDNEDVLVPGLVTYSEESDQSNDNTIHLEGALNQAYLDCRANSDIRNNLAGVYFTGSYAVVLEMRKHVLRYRNVKGQILNRAAFRYGTALVRDLQAVMAHHSDDRCGIVLHTEDDALFSLVNEEALGFAQYPILEPYGPITDQGYRHDANGFDIYQIMALYGQQRTYELGLVPSVDPDDVINICTCPFKK